MNFLAHALSHLDRPYMVAGTSVPDWLSVIDRRVRARSVGARLLLDDHDARVRDVAEGIIQHHEDDRWFHGGRAFAELNLEFAVELRAILVGDEGFRPSFLGHILVEMLIDSDLIEQDRGLVDQFYAALETLVPEVVQQSVNRIAKVETDRLAPLVPRFITERFLYDYVDDGKLLFRLNQVMRRVRLPALPETITPWLRSARRRVSLRRDELLSRDV
jgi:hypothetical protein